MPHEAYCVRYRNRRWFVFQGGREIGAFHFRIRALEFAVTTACHPNKTDLQNVYVLDQDGSFYTAWNCARDLITLQA